ncbi:MAG: dihydropteroate synthase [Bacteroidales bacterium]|nr:dihydropteroate synthase [Bacteroidales bacterium]
MAILNLTPDSFYDGGAYENELQILKKVESYLEEGADIIDIGAYSSRPNAAHISTQEELSRLIPIFKKISVTFPETVISVDTFRSEVARISVSEGAKMINDISGGNMDTQMFPTIAELKVPYILMHMLGTPQNMQDNPSYDNVTMQVMDFFQNKLDELKQLKVNDVILDVGFGFGKTINQNYELLQNLSVYKKFKKPILVGISRKSMLYKVLNSTPSEALNATSIAHTIAVLNGADILRVHDVKEAKEVATIVKQYKSSH